MYLGITTCEVQPMNRNFLSSLLLAALVSLFLGLASMAQSTGTGNITGVVADSNGSVVKGATVKLTSKQTNQSQTTQTSDDGIFNFVLLRPGSYSVEVTAPSFGKSTLAVEVVVGRTIDAN